MLRQRTFTCLIEFAPFQFGVYNSHAVKAPLTRHSRSLTEEGKARLRIAFVILEGMVTLDFLGVYDPISRIKTMGFRDDVEWDICALAEEITDSTSQLTIKTNVVKPDLSSYDMFIVPGGRGVNQARENPEFMDWIKAGRSARYKVGVCNGTLLLGEAGFLIGRKATNM